MKWNYCCERCGSPHLFIEDNSEVSWDNDDEGRLLEHWRCRDCGQSMNIDATVKVVNRTVRQ